MEKLFLMNFFIYFKYDNYLLFYDILKKINHLTVNF
jgi:hypothetical protein